MKAVYFRHHVIQEQDVRIVDCDHFERGRAVFSLDDFVAIFFKEAYQGLADARLIVGNQNLAHQAAYNPVRFPFWVGADTNRWEAAQSMPGPLHNEHIARVMAQVSALERSECNAGIRRAKVGNHTYDGAHAYRKCPARGEARGAVSRSRHRAISDLGPQSPDSGGQPGSARPAPQRLRRRVGIRVTPCGPAAGRPPRSLRAGDAKDRDSDGARQSDPAGNRKVTGPVPEPVLPARQNLNASIERLSDDHPGLLAVDVLSD